MTRLSLQEMAARFNLSARKFAAHVRRDEHFPRFIIGKRFYFDPASVEAYLTARQIETERKVVKFPASVRKSRTQKVGKFAEAVGL